MKKTHRERFIVMREPTVRVFILVDIRCICKSIRYTAMPRVTSRSNEHVARRYAERSSKVLSKALQFESAVDTQRERVCVKPRTFAIGTVRTQGTGADGSTRIETVTSTDWPGIIEAAEEGVALPVGVPD